jgi:hypothetical protein
MLYHILHIISFGFAVLVLRTYTSILIWSWYVFLRCATSLNTLCLCYCDPSCRGHRRSNGRVEL